MFAPVEFRRPVATRRQPTHLMAMRVDDSPIERICHRIHETIDALNGPEAFGMVIAIHKMSTENEPFPLVTSSFTCNLFERRCTGCGYQLPHEEPDFRVVNVSMGA